ncbi:MULTISPECIES: hypothetical protein [unclassified Streptomyces]|uniref:hypothetical protein n=1 Tax=unclassified Streptomyces TaxID=2593676 RepID=UPI001655D0DC|nr:hypothetical protein [Streptomyces sp. CB02980]MCB8902016.1 hypothetical protein [Streptomyces sp. CB02980]
MAERGRQSFDQEAVAKALRTKAQEATDPAYGEGQHFQVSSDKAFLSLDTFPEAGVSRITTKGARIELFGGTLPAVEDEGIVFLQKDREHEHSTVALHPDGALTLGYQVDTGAVSVAGLPDDVQDTAQIITNHEAVQTPTNELVEPEPETAPVVVAGPKPPEKAGPERMPGAFPDERPVIQHVVTTEPDPTTNGQAQDAESQSLQDEHPLQRAARIRQQDQAHKESAGRQRGGKAGTGLSLRSVRLTLGRLRSALNLAVRRGWVARNVAEHVRVSREAVRKAAQADAKRRPWDEAGFKAFIEAIKGDRLFGVMLLTLIAERPAEVRGTRWEEDADLTGSGTIAVGNTRTIVYDRSLPKGSRNKVVEKDP